ncbi:MAG: dephospho-CoA kinase [Gemmatimonadetes bacterium]|nr:dephospho-CoA kinase [Gemmatimonadota bacterium]MYC91979.1 dephospho-CoA kinase [Gemmatimonadota bacterium]MYG36065.1 dephospho-CoA kinase [Gemmatimonadota bacterium]
MIVVGLTGNMAAGKSAVADLWRRAGVPVVSADELAREAVKPGSPGLARVAALLGPEALDAEGAMDRAAVRRIVFGDDGLRRGLEAIIHPEVRRLRDEWTAVQRAARQGVVVWEIPLLFEAGIARDVDVVVLVDAPPELRRRRAMETRGLSAEEVDAMMAAQMSADLKRQRADFVIENGGPREQLAERAAEVVARIRSGAV